MNKEIAKEAFEILCSWDDNPSEENALKIKAFEGKKFSAFSESDGGFPLQNLLENFVCYMARNKRQETMDLLK